MLRVARHWLVIMPPYWTLVNKACSSSRVLVLVWQCKAMNRNITSVLLGGYGTSSTGKGKETHITCKRPLQSMKE